MARKNKNLGGRPKTPMEVLEKRGSWLAKARKKEDLRAKYHKPEVTPTKKKSRIISKERMLNGIPGYDPTDKADDFKFVYAKARAAVEFFHQELRHVKGELTGQLFILEPWEQAIVGNLFGWLHKKTALRRYRECFIEIARKNGKMLDLRTLLPSPNGWTSMGEIELGDKVFDENGLPCEVIYVGGIDNKPESYLMTFSNGEEVKACADHLWLTSARVNMPGVKKGHKISRKGKTCLTRIRTTKEIYETQFYGIRQDRNHSINMPDPLCLPALDLPIEPYVLGCWLGDGDSDAARITMHKDDWSHFSCAFNDAGYSLNYNVSKRGVYRCQIRAKEVDSYGNVSVCTKTSVKNLQKVLRKCNLLKNKHIPKLYLRGSYSQRLALLQGLMDTDGTAARSGLFAEYTTISKVLADNVCELLASLGVKFSCRQKDATLYGRVVSQKYRIQFSIGKDILPVFRMSRKISRLRNSCHCKTANRSRTVQIVSVEPCEAVPMRCIAVDSPSRLYLFGKTMLPTHNTPIAAGILLYILFEDGEPGAEIYGAASEYKQASLVFTHAWGMVNQNPILKERSKIFKGQSKSMEVGEPGDTDYGVYRVISSDAFTAHGFNTHAAVIDELHTQPNRDLTDALMTSTGARRQPLIVYVTTSDFEREGSICNEKENYAMQIMSGVIDDISFLPVIYQAKLEDDFTDIKTWKKANPNLGVSVSEEYLARECKRAIEIPSYENTFKRLHLNIRTEQDVRWLPLKLWDGCSGTLLPEALVGCKCYAGLDLAATRDITAFVLWFPEEKKVVPYFWIPKENAHERERRDKVPYITWANEGYIRLTDGNSVDYETVMGDIKTIGELYDIQGIAFDRFGFEAIRQKLIAEGIPEDIFISFGQGYLSMSPATKELERVILKKGLEHGGNPVLRWMAGNVSIEMDSAGNIKPSKKKSTEKIDGIVSLIMALGLSITTVGKQASVYEGRGILAL